MTRLVNAYVDGGHIWCLSGEEVIFLDVQNQSRSSVCLPDVVRSSEILGVTVSPAMTKLAIASSPSESSEIGVHLIDLKQSNMVRSVSVKRTPSSTVRKLFLRWNFLCIVCDSGVLLYDVPSLQLSKRQETISNPFGCCAWSTDANRVVMSCLGLQRGTVRIERFFPSKSSSVFAAHDSPVVGLAISGNGLHIATVSETGTLVRVHAVGEESPLLFEIRRSNMPPLLGNPPRPSCLFLSPSGSFIGVIEESGGKDTLNIFRTPIAGHDARQSLLVNEGSAQGVAGLISKYLGIGPNSLWVSISLPCGQEWTGTFGPTPCTVIVGGKQEGNFFAYKFRSEEPNSISSPIPVAMRTDQPSGIINPDDEINGWEILTDFSSVYTSETSFW